MSRQFLHRNFRLASVCTLAFAQPALAADLPLRAPPPPPPPPAFTWTGFYLGAQIGYLWGINNGNVSFVTPGGLIGGGNLGGDAQGVIGGGHLGYNYQINQWVVGIEGSVDGTTAERNILLASPDPNGAVDANGNAIGSELTGTVRTTIQGSIRGRLGFAFDRLLIYTTGGVAFGAFSTDFQLTGFDPVTPFYASASRSTTRTGWTVGGGVQYAINRNWSVRAEYRYSDFGNLRDVPTIAVPGLVLSGNRTLAQNQVQVGFSYRFDNAVAPVLAKY